MILELRKYVHPHDGRYIIVDVLASGVVIRSYLEVR